jgi:site-specific DNA-methyltransferase (adenine-specific)
VDEVYLESLAVKYPSLTKFIATVGDIHSKAMMAYLTYMAQRIIEMHRVLKDTGSLYLHCDATAAHYLKILLDKIFGKNNFKNEIIWRYSSGGASKKHYSKNHDNIYFYTKSKKYIFNPNNVRIPRTKEVIRRINTGSKNATRAESLDKLPEDIFDIQYINAMAKERTGYKTQKPLALLQRIIGASSDEGDIVLDPFCGCATTCVAALHLGRKWLGIDLEKQAVQLLIDRLSNDAGIFRDFINTNIVPQRTDIKIEQFTESIKERLYKEQNGKCNACGVEFAIWNLEIDHIVPKAKGGGDYYENYQLLCGSCNRIKGDRPMEYLRLKIKTREELMKNKIVFGE